MVTIASDIAATNTLVDNLGGPSGYGEISVPRNDDGSTSYDITSVFESGLTIAGNTYSEAFVNTNGTITLGAPLFDFVPYPIGSVGMPVLAPFWADVDTREPAGIPGAEIAVDFDTEADAMTVSWPGVNYFPMLGDLQNHFQAQILDRGDGEYDLVLRYEDIQWTSGLFAPGSHARAGYSDGTGGNFFELPQSGDPGALLGLPNAASNTDTPGLWVFEIRNEEAGTDDHLAGTRGGDVLSGEGGDDVINGGGGLDSLFGGSGEDELDGGNGGDWLYGEQGDDVLSGGNGNDVVYGGSSNDTLYGGTGLDTLYGDAGSDTIEGGNGDDVIDGGGSGDVLRGNNGNDTVMGGTGHDTLYGGNGQDRLVGGSGNEALTGGNGADTFAFQPGFGNDTITDFQVAGANHDILEFDSNAFADLNAFLANSVDTQDGVLATSFLDTVLIEGVTIAQLQAHPEDLHFV
jgi:serralysin